MGAVQVGVLQIDLVANTASFTNGLTKAEQQMVATGGAFRTGFGTVGLAGRNAGKQIEDSMDGANFKMQEARGTLMLVGEEIGVHMPRHVATFVATLPGVGVALSAAFSAVAIIALIELLVKAGEKLYEFFTAAEKGYEKYKASLDAAVGKQLELTQALELKQQGPIAEKTQEILKLTVGLEVAQHAADNAAKALKKMQEAAQASADIGKLEGGSSDPEDYIDKIAAKTQQAIIQSSNATAEALKQQIAVQNTQLTDMYSKQGEEEIKNNREVNNQQASDDKKHWDDSIRLFESGYKARASLRKIGAEEEMAIADVVANSELANNKAFADKEYANDKLVQEALIAQHQSGTEADRKIIQDAQTQLQLLKLKHDATIQDLEIQHQIKLNDILSNYNKQRIAEEDKQEAETLRKQKEAFDKQQRALQEDLRAQQKGIQDKEKLDNDYYSGLEQHINAMGNQSRISHAEELKELLELNQKKYAAEIDLLNKKVKIVAQELILEANKNGQFLTMDQALVKARENLDAQYLDAKQKKENADQKATDASIKQQSQLFKQFGDGFTSNLAEMLTTGKAQWADYFKSIEQALVKLALNAIFMKLLGGLTIGGVNLGSIFGGGKAGGGSVYPDRVYEVGEMGKEYFVPPTAGTIVNQSQMMSMAGGKQAPLVIQQSFNFPNSNPDLFMRSQSQVAASAARAARIAQDRNS